MEVIIKGEANEIAALLLETVGRRGVPFTGEMQCCSIDKTDLQPTSDSVKEAL